MDSTNIINSRLLNQQISKQHFITAKEAVEHMGAIQAQDYAMAKWAIGLRSGLNEKAVNEAINKFEIIRTHFEANLAFCSGKRYTLDASTFGSICKIGNFIHG